MEKLKKETPLKEKKKKKRKIGKKFCVRNQNSNSKKEKILKKKLGKIGKIFRI